MEKSCPIFDSLRVIDMGTAKKPLKIVFISGDNTMTLIVQDAFYGYFSRYVMAFVLAPASIMLVGNLIYIAVGIFKELHVKKTDRAGKDTV